MKSATLRTLLLFVGLPVGIALLLGSSLLPLLGAYAAWLAIMIWGARRSDRSGGAKKADRAGIAFMLFLFLLLPTALASVVAASWRQIAIAYAIWFGLLGLAMLQGLMSRRVTNAEAVGWPMIMGMFLTMAAVPVLTLALRVTGTA